MVQAHAETVTVGEAAAETVGIGNEGGFVVTVGFLIGILLHVHDGAVIHVVGTQLHLVVKQIPVAVHAGVPGSGETVAAAESAAAHTAHHAHAAHHAAHHIAGQVRETPVVGVVAAGDEAKLCAFRELAHHEVALIAPVVGNVGLGRGGEVVTAAGRYVAENAVHHALLDTEVDDGFLVAVVDAGEFGLLALLLHHLYLLNHLGREVLGSQLRVVQEEGFAGNGDFGDGFTVDGDGTVFAHLYAGKLLQEVFQHVVVADLERRGIIFNGVFLDDDGIAHGAYGSGVQHLLVLFHLDDAQIGIGLEVNFFLIGLVAHEFGLEGVYAGTHFLNGGLAVRSGERVLGLSLGGGHGNGGETHGFAGGSIL